MMNVPLDELLKFARQYGGCTHDSLIQMIHQEFDIRRRVPQSPVDKHHLATWAYLHATEGHAWPDDNTIIAPLVKLAERKPTQADADRLKAGASLKMLLAVSRPDGNSK